MLGAVGLAAPGVPRVHAQVQLPTITVTTPSPIRRPATKAAPGGEAKAPAEPEAASGTPLQIEPDPNFAAITVLAEKELLSQSYDQLGDALATKPGIASSSFAPGASRPIIRGLSGFRVGITENGLMVGDVSALSDDHAVPVDPNATRQVEVVRGPATLRYGSPTIGGVVNALNDRIPEMVPPLGIVLETRGGISSVDGSRNGSALVEAGSGSFVAHADMFSRTASDYGIPGGKQANTSLDSEGFSVGGSWIVGNGFVGMAFGSLDSTYFIPGIEAAADRNHIVLHQAKWTSRGEWRVDSATVGSVRFWLGATDYRHNEVDGLGAGAVIGSTFLSTLYEARVEAQLRPVETGLGELRGAIGTQWYHRDLSAAGEDGVLLAPATTQSLAAFIFEELQVAPKLRLQFAARIEGDDVSGTAAAFPPGFIPPPDDPVLSDARSRFMPKSVSFGALYDLPLGVVARLTGQHVERAPDATELFYKGPHDSTATWEIGNPDLRIESANTVELGFKRAKGDFRFDASAYRTGFQSFIFKRFTGAKCDGDFASCGTGSEFDQAVYSQRDATFYGAELQTEYDIARLWRGVWGIEGQYDFVHATFDDGSYVPKIPPHRLGGGVYFRDANWLARLSLLHAFAHTQVADFESSTPGYNLLNAEVSYTFKLDKQGDLVPEMTIGLKAENLLDDDIRLSTSYKSDEVLQPGRNVRLFGSMKLN
jgi:iron complex outermembrane receptor protein